MTPEQRRQAIDFAGIRGTGMPIPQGIIPASSRAHVTNIYYEAPAAPSTIYFWRNKNLLAGLWSSKQTPSSTWSSKRAPSTSWKGKIPPPDSSTQEI
jgi:hypothetical protein